MSWWEVFWFFLPAGVANLSPVFANKIPVLNRWKTPLDFGRQYKGIRILGPNKTWRGLVFGTFMAVVIGLLQYRVIASSAETTTYIIAASAALGFGALTGDAIESFFKRRQGISSGDRWFPFDQTDYIIGGLLFVSPFVDLTAEIVIMTLLLYVPLHLLTSYLSFLAGLKEKPI